MTIKATLKVDLSDEGFKLLRDSISCLREFVESPCDSTMDRATAILATAKTMIDNDTEHMVEIKKVLTNG